MKDFSHSAYERYIRAIKSSYPNILRFDEFFLTDPKPASFCLIRHDVDRRPKRALQMAKLEKEMSINSTYYFRARPYVFKPEIIEEISRLGHEIGYHYESLSDTNGDLSRALEDFKNNLRKFRRIVPVQTISMHGRPLKPYDNRDIWRDPQNHQHLVEEIAVLGEVYLDIDYRDIVYITDTGRNWSPIRSNIRGFIESSRKLDLRNGLELYKYFSSNPYPRLVFQVHPERWTKNLPDYFLSVCFDAMANFAKSGVNFVRDKRQ